MEQKTLNGSQLKVIAMAAMTIDHVTSVLFPGYPKVWWILLLHIIGRMAAPIFWFFVAEGYYYTHDRKQYAGRLLVFALISHFAYNFAFGIPFIPFKNCLSPSPTNIALHPPYFNRCKNRHNIYIVKTLNLQQSSTYLSF